MARLFNGSSTRIDAAAPVTSVPLTLFHWGKPANVTADFYAFFIGDKDSTNNFLSAIRWLGSSLADKIAAFTWSPSANGNAQTSTSYSAGVWSSAHGLFPATNSRSAYLNGGGAGANGTNVSPSSIDRLTIGVSGDSTPANFFSGDIGLPGYLRKRIQVDHHEVN